MQAFLTTVRRVTDSVAIVANAAGTLVVLGLVLVVNYDAAARGFFSAPFLGAVEVVQFSMVLIVFLQLPDVCRVNRLTRSDGFLILIADRYPAVSQIMRQIINAVSATFFALIAVAVWPDVPEAWHTGDFFGVPGVFTAPWWPVKLAIFLSASLCTIIFAIKVISPREVEPAVRLGEHEDAP